MIFKRASGQTEHVHTRLIVCLSESHIVCTLWAMDIPHVQLHEIQQTITEIPLYIAGQVLNLALLCDIIKPILAKSVGTPLYTDVLLALDYRNEQVVTSAPRQGVSEHKPDNSEHMTYLYTQEDGANVWLCTKLDPDILVQLQLLAKRLHLTLGLVSSFSLCCLSLYFQTVNPQRRQHQLRNDLKRANFCFSGLPDHTKLADVAHIADDTLHSFHNTKRELCAATGAISMARTN